MCRHAALERALESEKLEVWDSCSIISVIWSILKILVCALCPCTRTKATFYGCVAADSLFLLFAHVHDLLFFSPTSTSHYQHGGCISDALLCIDLFNRGLTDPDMRDDVLSWFTRLQLSHGDTHTQTQKNNNSELGFLTYNSFLALPLLCYTNDFGTPIVVAIGLSIPVSRQ